MKKTLAVLLAICTLITCFTVFVSCDKSTSKVKPELNFNKAAKALDKEGYTIKYLTGNELNAMIYAPVVAGTGVKECLLAYYDYRNDFGSLDNGDRLEYYLGISHDEQLWIFICLDNKMADMTYKELKLYYNFTIDKIELQIKELEHMVEKYDLSSDEIEEYKKTVQDLKTSLDEFKKRCVIGKSGNAVWLGTATAVEDSKG